VDRSEFLCPLIVPGVTKAREIFHVRRDLKLALETRPHIEATAPMTETTIGGVVSITWLNSYLIDLQQASKIERMYSMSSVGEWWELSMKRRRGREKLK
jgi:hypothetical protein